MPPNNSLKPTGFAAEAADTYRYAAFLLNGLLRRVVREVHRRYLHPFHARSSLAFLPRLQHPHAVAPALRAHALFVGVVLGLPLMPAAHALELHLVSQLSPPNPCQIHE